MKKLISVFAIACIIAPAVFAQKPDPKVPQGENLKVPEGWQVRFDHADHDATIGDDPETADIYFVNMTPGWHVTTGPAAIFYHPVNTVEGDFSVKAKLHLFNPNGRNREGYGIFIGGEDLDGDNQEYLYFLIRNTGDYLVKEREGDETETVKGWTASEAIVKYTEDSGSSAENNLEVKVSGDDLTFIINGVEVATLSDSDLDTDGIFGLRVNHSVNLHVEDLGLSN